MTQLAIDFTQPSPTEGDPEKPTILDVVACKAGMFLPDFPAWLAANFHIWKAFEREANRVSNRGRSRYSGRTIIEVLRHESALRDNYGEWKLSDWWTPDLCRLYMLMHPEREGFFELRVSPKRKAA